MERLLSEKLRKKRWNAKVVAMAICGGLLVLCLAAGILGRGGNVPAEALEAISVDGSFLTDSRSALLSTDGRVTRRYLQSNLHTDPAVSLTVSQVTDRLFSVRFSSVPDKGLHLRLRPPRGYGDGRDFPLQAQRAQQGLKVKLVGGGQPDQMEIGAPVVLLFSQDVSAGQLAGHLTLSSQVPIDISCTNNVAVIRPKEPLEYDKRYYVAVSSGLKAGGMTLAQTYNTEFVTAAAPTIYTKDFQRAEGLKDPTAAKAEPLTVEVLFGGSDSAMDADPKGNITLLFSAPVSREKLTQSLHVEPEAQFSVLCKGNAAILTPNPPLEENRQYTLRVGAGLEAKDGARLDRMFEKQFTTRSGFLKLSITNQQANVADVSNPITLEFSMEHPGADHQLVELSVFRLDNYEQYRKLLTLDQIQRDYGLLEVASSTEILRNGLNTVRLPNPGKGIYLVRAAATDATTGQTRTLYKCLNVTDLSVYLQTANDQTLVWVNGTTDAQPREGVKVTVTGRRNGEAVAEGVTGPDGCAELLYAPRQDGAEREQDTVLALYDGGDTPVYVDTTASVNLSGYGVAEETQRYYTFFFTDRTLYHPTDTIHFWGFIKPYLLNKDPLPAAVRVIFDRDGLAETAEVPLGRDGTFTGEIAIEKVVSSQYMLEACLVYPPEGDREERLVAVDRLWLEAKEFEKPVYQLTTQAAKPLFASPEQVEASATLQFYDGTPLPDYPLEVSVMNLMDGNVQEVKRVRTDASGTAAFTFRPDAGLGQQAPDTPRQCYYVVTLAGDGETVRARGTYRYQAAGIVADAQVQPDGGQSVQVRIATNAPDASRVTTEEQAKALSPYDEYGYYNGDGEWGDSAVTIMKRCYDALAGPPVDVGLHGTLLVSYTDLSGARREESIPVAGVTRNGVYKASFSLEAARDPKQQVGAELQIRCVDNDLNLVAINWSGGAPAREAPAREREPVKGYTLAVTVNSEPQPREAVYNYLGHNDLTVADGDLLTFRLCKDGVPVKNEGRILYQLLQERPLARQIVTGDSFQLREQVGYGKSVFLTAAYFDGREVHPIQDTAIRLDLDSVRLQVEVEPDQAAYRPGDPVNLAVRVRDRKGAPVQSRFCLCVVDESIFALSEQYIDVVESLYGQVSFASVFVRKYTTSLGDGDQYPTGGDGGKGEGDLSAYDLIRENFKDTALFLPASTDAGGNASVSFTLPDNITAWRVTTVSVGDGLYGGHDKGALITTLPFFSKPVITSRYIEGDDVSMLIQGHGEALMEDAGIEYQVRITGDGLDRTVTAAGKAYEQALISFGKLPAGEYMVASTARYGNYRDTVKLPLTVVSSSLELMVHREVSPDRLSELAAARYPVTLTLYDKEHMPFYRTVSGLLTHFCSRADQRLSRYVAKRALTRYYSAENLPRHISETDGDVSGLQRADGGISWWNSADETSDPLLTAKAALVAGDQFGQKRMAAYLEKARESASGTTQAAVCAGLAALKPETVRDINRTLDASSLPMEEKLYYLAGLAWGGDEERARALYERDVSPYVKAGGGGKRLVYTNQRAEDDGLTATAWLTASKLGLADADGFALYFAGNRWGISTAFESMVYVENYRKTVPALAPVVYTANGRSYTVDLGIAGQHSLTLGKSELETIRFTSLPEQVQAMVLYIGEPQEADLQPSSMITIEKEVADDGDQGWRNMITVRFADDAPTGFYDISDCIPSNMRFFSMDQETDVYQYSRELQRLYFTLYRADEDHKEFRIVYNTRQVFAAQTVLDRVYIVNADSGEYAFSERRETP